MDKPRGEAELDAADQLEREADLESDPLDANEQPQDPGEEAD